MLAAFASALNEHGLSTNQHSSMIKCDENHTAAHVGVVVNTIGKENRLRNAGLCRFQIYAFIRHADLTISSGGCGHVTNGEPSVSQWECSTQKRLGAGDMHTATILGNITKLSHTKTT